MKINITHGPRVDEGTVGGSTGDKERGTNESVVTRESAGVQQLDQHSETSHKYKKRFSAADQSAI